MYIKNRRNSSKFKACGTYELRLISKSDPELRHSQRIEIAH